MRLSFFFSSRRRHTRWTGDWSSDVCSSDLATACERAQNPAETGSPAGRARRSSRFLRECGEHVEVESVPRVKRSSAGELAQRRKDSQEIVGLQTIGRHVQIGGKFFDCEVFAGLETGERGDLRGS